MENIWSRGLNPEQISAVNHNYGPLLILAGAGSGKTTVLVSRTGRLIDEKVANPKQICVLTFTNKAARELKERVSAKLGPLSKGVWAGTFHSFGLKILKTFHKEAKLPKGFGILDSSDSQALIKELLKDFNLAEKADFDAGKLSFKLSDWRSKGKVDDPADDPYTVATHWLLPRYVKRLHHLGVVDFDELLLRPLDLLENNKEVRERVQNAFTQLMVDEFQDTNITQLKLVMAVSDSHKNITVVGDDDQSIYGWRGACIDNILGFPHLYEKCKVIRLESNYRSSQAILKVANKVIEKNLKRHPKVLRPAVHSKEGSLPELFVYDSEDQEVERTCDDIESQKRNGEEFKNIAILFRSNGQGATFEAELKKRQIPYKVSGGTSFFDRKEIKDVLAYLRCSLRPHEVAFRRIINTPGRGIGDTSVEALQEFSNTNSVSFIEACKKWREASVNLSAGESIDKLFKQIEDLAPNLINGSIPGTACAKLMWFLKEIGYDKYLSKISKDTRQAQMKWGLIETFGNVLDKFFNKGGATLKTLGEFLEAMELRDDESEEEQKESAVQLLTLHACKGLEFPVVYLVGIEEDILPHKTLGTDPSEERRLFYVGVTRAQKHLIMSRSKERRRYGAMVNAAPSRFLLEIPKELYKEHGSGRALAADQRRAMLDALYKKIESNF